MDDFDLEIKKDFLVDAKGLLDQAEGAFIAIERGDKSPELLNNVFRLAHNIKGSGMAVGFDDLSHLAHHLEDVLAAIKNDKLKVNKSVVSVLLKGLDGLRSYIQGLEGDLKFTMDCSGINSQLKEILSSDLVVKVTTEDEVVSLAKELTQVTPDEPESNVPMVQKVRASEPCDSERPQPQRNAATVEEFLRVSMNKLDMLLNNVGELVINQSIMTSHRHNETVSSDHAIQTLAYIEKLVAEIQDVTLTLRMTPVRPLFQKMNRIVRDVSTLQGKNILLMTEGEHVELDKTVIEHMSDALTHLLRNAADHGIEDAEERKVAGKSEQASIRLSAEQKENHIFLIISDDGRGLDRERILKKGIEKGFVKPGSELNDQEVYSLIFRPGFSTKEEVTDISGRGVGMDVVMQTVTEMKGDIQIQTEKGKGTSFIISLPLSLSIISGMIVRVGDRKYVVPVAQLLETIEYNKVKIETTTGIGRMMNLRGEVIPIYSMRTLLGQPNKKEACPPGFGLVASAFGRKVSFEVDEIIGQQQIVIKKLGLELAGLPGIVGGAILNDGEPGLILSLHEFIDRRSGYAA
ncbi:MAG: chemotaxis protein CheA [Bdellovibrio sp.]|nr:chemotaxis protein CheA [Bdellovibrio sp.]